MNWSREVKLRIAHLELLHLKHVDMDWFPWVKFWKIKDKFSKKVLSSCKYFTRFELRNFGNVTTWIQEWSRASPKSSLFYNGGTQQSLRTDNLWPSNPERTGITANFMEGEESENLAKTQREGPRIINEGSENQTCTSMRDKRRPQLNTPVTSLTGQWSFLQCYVIRSNLWGSNRKCPYQRGVRIKRVTFYLNKMLKKQNKT